MAAWSASLTCISNASPISPKYKVSFLTEFDTQLSLEQWNELKQKNSDTSAIRQHTQKFLDNGLLLSQNIVFLGYASRWDLVFKDRKAYEKWNKEVTQLKHRQYDQLAVKSTDKEKYIV